MKLLDEIKLRQHGIRSGRPFVGLNAGGPGSGRHAEGGSNPMHDEMHKFMTGIGFNHYHTNDQGTKLYNHPAAGASARLRQDGKFNITTHEGGTAQGQGMGDLKKATFAL